MSNKEIPEVMRMQDAVGSKDVTGDAEELTR